VTMVKVYFWIAFCARDILSEGLIEGSHTIADGLSHIAWLRFTISHKKGASAQEEQEEKDIAAVPRERIRQREGRHARTRPTLVS